MILKTTTNEFCFINVSFYETVADPRHFFSQEYDEMPEYEEESDFDFDSYCNAFMPYVQEWADEVKERLYEYGVKDIKVTSVGHPREYNYGTDWMEVEVEFRDGWRQMLLSNIGKIIDDDRCRKYAEVNYKSVQGYIFFGPENLKEFEKEIIEKNPNSGYDPAVLLNMYLTLAFVKEFGFVAEDAWYDVVAEAFHYLQYHNFATTEMLIPEGSEYLFNDVHTAEADELYHHVLDKYGWAWRDPKYKSETELCAMLKWAKEKGLTIEELSI